MGNDQSGLSCGSGSFSKTSSTAPPIPPLLQRPYQGIFRNHTAPSDVYQNRGRLHGRKRCVVKFVKRVRGARKRVYYVIRKGQKFLETVLGKHLFGLRDTPPGFFVAPNAHSEMVGGLSKVSSNRSDAANTEQASFEAFVRDLLPDSMVLISV